MRLQVLGIEFGRQAQGRSRLRPFLQLVVGLAQAAVSLNKTGIDLERIAELDRRLSRLSHRQELLPAFQEILFLLLRTSAAAHRKRNAQECCQNNPVFQHILAFSPLHGISSSTLARIAVANLSARTSPSS